MDELLFVSDSEMAFFVLIGVLRGFPAAAYRRRAPSCPALRGPQPLVRP
jgi:hypothetical protein